VRIVSVSEAAMVVIAVMAVCIFLWGTNVLG